MPGRVLAIDFGTRRIGLAVSDALGMTAQGLATIERTRREDDLRRIQLLAEEYAVEKVIIGRPLSQAGGETAMSHRVEKFADDLRRRIESPVELWDERLTSAEATRMLRQAGLSIAKRQRATDRVAATLLLQSYLDSRALARLPDHTPEAQQ